MKRNLKRFICSVAMALCATSFASAVPVTDGMLLWLDASDGSTLFTDAALTMPANPGDPIGGWADKSGNGYHATQVDDIPRPMWEAEALSGQPALRFSSADADGMLIHDDLSVTRPYTVFIVNQYQSDTGTARGRTLQARNGANWLTGLWAGNVSAFADGFIGSNVPSPFHYPVISDTTGTPAGESTLFVNNTDITTNPAPVGSPGQLGLVSGGQFAELSDADISEVVIYDRVLSATELTDVRSFLNDKYSVPEWPPVVPPAQVNFGQLGTFTGGDAGEGLDLSGNFAYALNIGGPAVVAGDANFTDASEAGMLGGSSAGATVTDANEISNWHTATYGDSAADDAMETVMESIRWNQPPGVDVTLDVEPGQEYKLQLMFAESCCDRGFDITVDGELAVDDFNVQRSQGGINNTEMGVVYSHTFTATDGVLTVSLGGANFNAADNNAILNGLTLEAVPEPSSVSLLLLGAFGLLSRRRRS